MKYEIKVFVLSVLSVQCTNWDKEGSFVSDLMKFCQIKKNSVQSIHLAERLPFSRISEARVVLLGVMYLAVVAKSGFKAYKL